MRLPVPASDIIPHRGAMLLIDSLEASENGAGSARTTLPATCLTTGDDGVIDRLTLVELVAQTYAAVVGWEMIRAGHDFPIGYLVGVQKFACAAPARAGETLTVNVETVGEFEGFAIVEGTVLRGETVLATAKIKLWVPPEDQ